MGRIVRPWRRYALRWVLFQLIFSILSRDKNPIHCGWQNKFGPHRGPVARQPVCRSFSVLMTAADVLAPSSVTFWLSGFSQIRHGCKTSDNGAVASNPAQKPALEQNRGWQGDAPYLWMTSAGNPAPSLSFFSEQIPGKPCQDVAQY